MAAESRAFKLPYSIATTAELGRILREAEAIEDAMRQNSLRKSGEATILPKVSRTMNELVESNELNLLQDRDRKQLVKSLQYIKTQAPSIHISFSVDPSSAFVRQLITWFREEMHPYLVIRIGLQPSIGAGCIVRTANKYFDLSLRERFTQQKQLLIDKLHEPAAAAREADEQPA